VFIDDIEGSKIRRPSWQALPLEICPTRCIERAAAHGRSTEAEVRVILEGVVKPAQRIRMGDALAKIGRSVGLTDVEAEGINPLRDRTPAEPMRFE